MTTTKTPVLVTTSHRGVFVGLMDSDHDRASDSIELEGAVMVIYWGTTGGVLQLASEGRQPRSRVGTKAPGEITLTGVTMVADVSAKAWASF